MANPDHSKLWLTAISEYKQKLSAEDRSYFNKQVPLSRDQIISSLSAATGSQKQSSSTSVVPDVTVDKIQHLTRLLAIFTASIPEVSSVIWASVGLINERSNANSDTRAVFHQAMRDISSAIPQFNAYEEVFADMEDVEASIIQFYCKVFAFFLAVLDRIKRCSSWTHRIGVLPAPFAVQRAAVDIENHKNVVERHVAAANLILQTKRHKEIRELLAEMAVQASSKPATNLPCHVIPYSANPQFHGRQEILDQIKVHLAVSRKERSSFAISGLGGVGKTQIALKYIYEHIDEYPAVFWMQADTHQKLAESYVNAAKRLQLEPEDSQKDADSVATILKTWLGEVDDSWLIVYDNADDLSVLKPFWPPGNRGCIIITSRDPGATRLANAGMQISPLSPAEGETLFVSLLTNQGSRSNSSEVHNRARVAEIIKQLGYLPLAIVQVSSFILECDCTLEEFQDLYHSSHQSNQGLSDLETSSINLFYEYSLATVWKVSITRLSVNALKLLRIMSYFDPDGVPESLLWEGSKKSRKNELGFLRMGRPYFSAVQELISRGLLTKGEMGAMSGYSTTQARSLAIHRLVQETVFHQLSEEEQAEILDDALGLMLSAWPVNHDNPFRMNALWPACSLYLPHVLALEARCRDAPYLKPRTESIRLFFYASWYLYERRMSELAFPLLETARSISTQGGDIDPFFPKLLTAYGSVCLECDRLPESAKWFSKVVDIYRVRYAEEQKAPEDGKKKEYNWLLATAMSDLGCACVGMRDYTRAEELFNEGIRVASGVTDETARKDWIVHVSHNLSRLYIEMGRPEEALKLQFEYGDELAGGLINENSQRGALFLYGIGNAYLALGHKKGLGGAEDRATALKYHTRALKIRQQLCGEHYITGVSLHKVGALLHSAGDCKASESALQQAIDIFDEAFSADREKARSLFYLSVVKADLGEELEGARLLTEAWQYLAKITGKERKPEYEKDSGLFDRLVLYVQN